MARVRGDTLLTGEWAVLGVLGTGPAHGFAVSRRLSRQGDVGRVWSLSRPLAYRAIDQLGRRGLVEPVRSEAGEGPDRTVVAITPEGARRLREWLSLPVGHVRDIRSELLLKLVLCELNAVEREPLLRAQLDALAPVFAALGSDDDTPAGDAVTVWRQESARAAERFLRRLLASP